jgi:hypothetical protein
VENGYADAHGNPHAGGPLTDAQRKLLEQKNAEAVAIIARLGDEGENPDTPESILNGPLKSVWGSNLGWMPATAKWDLRQQYKGYSDKDIALMEAARRNGVRASTLLAQAGKLPESQVTALRLRGLGVLADATLNIAMALAPYESITALGSKALLGAGEVAVGTGVKDIASQLESSGLDLRVGAKPKLPKMPKAVVADYWSRYPYFNVNPARGINNCANSAIALEATLAGRLASALPGDGMGMSIPEFESAFGNRFFNVTGRKDIEDLLNKSDARGVVLGMRERSSHAFNAVNIDGTIYYINGANGGDAAYSFSRYKYFRLAITNRGTRIKNAH